MRHGRTGRWWLQAAATGLLLIGAAGFAACGDDDDDAAGTTPAATQAATQAPSGDAADVEAAMKQVFDNWNAKNTEGFLALFTDAGLISLFGEEGQTVDQVKAGLVTFLGGEPITAVTISNTKASGSTGTTEAQFAVGGGLEKNSYDFVKAGDAWKIDKETPLSVDVPEGTQIVHVDGNEFAFGVNTSEITDGDVAFEFANIGEQPHELVLMRIPAEAVIDDLLQQFAASEEGDVPGTEFAGFVSAEPGETFNLVFGEPLTAGRYLMICFFPDLDEGEEGTPHALKGMTKDFTLE